jgi:two-component system alkaline phosphatase synthesis response regulator PhoP
MVSVKEIGLANADLYAVGHLFSWESKPVGNLHMRFNDNRDYYRVVNILRTSRTVHSAKVHRVVTLTHVDLWHLIRVVSKKILIVEDESDLIKLLKYNLEKEGFRVNYASDGSIALAEVRRDPPDLVILDLMLPGLDGLEVCRQLRRSDRFVRTPVLILSARGDEADRVVGLELGADDYVTKPFSMREMIARVRALLRRNETGSPLRTKVQRGELTIDPAAHSVTVAGRPVDLSALEFRLLHYMALHPGMVFSRDQLLDSVWGNDRTVTPRSVDVYIRRIREKIELKPQDPAYVQTIHGVGYRFATNGDES